MPPTKPPAGKLNAKTGGIKHKYWLLGGAGVAAIGYVYYARRQANTATVDPTATDVTDPGYDPNAGYDTGYGSGAGGTYGAPMPTVDTTASDQALAQAAQAEADSASALGSIAATMASPVETNQDWMHHAIQTLEHHGYTYWQARHAVADYLAGAPLTQKQAHTIETAVGIIGPAPTTPPPIVIHNPHNSSSGSKSTGSKSASGAKSSKSSNKQPPTKKPIVVGGKKFTIGGFGVLRPVKHR